MSKPSEAILFELNEQNINSFLDLEKARRALLQAYHSNIQTHAAYLIAIIVGALTLFSRTDVFFGAKTFWYNSGLVFLCLFDIIVIAGVWTLLRIEYWTSYVNFTLLQNKKNISLNFNSKNKRVQQGKRPDRAFLQSDGPPSDFLSPSSSVVIQWAVDEIHYNGEGLGFAEKLSLCTNRWTKLFLVLSLLGSSAVLLIGLGLHMWILPFGWKIW